MTESAPPSLVTHVVGDGEDAITYDVRGEPGTTPGDHAVLMMVGSPMSAEGFGSLAAHFADRVVVTCDPRGSGRNPTGTGDVPPELHAADLHRVVEALGAGPVDVFASSGGAVNALVLAEQHPEDLHVLVAHEPPTVALLPDAEAAVAVVEDIKATYHRQGHGPAMAKFIALVMAEGELTRDDLDRPAPDPAQFGMSAEDDGSRDDPLMRNMPSCNTYRPDPSALAALGRRLVVGVGAESGEQLAARVVARWRRRSASRSRGSPVGTRASSAASSASTATPSPSRRCCARSSAERGGVLPTGPSSGLPGFDRAGSGTSTVRRATMRP